MQPTAAAQPLDHARPGPLRELLALAIPTSAQMASYTAMQFLDTWMLTRPSVPPDAATAAANAGLLNFAVISLGVGALFLVNTLASQAFGRKDYPACGRTLWQGVWFALLYAIPCLPLALYRTNLFATWLGHEPVIAAMETTYFQIAFANVFFKLAGTAINQYLLAIDRPRAVFLGTAVGMTANAIAGYAFILGHFGFQPHGVAGAAWAMNVGVLVETATFALFAFAGSTARLFHAFDARLRPTELLTLIRVGLPAGVQILADVLAWSLFIALVIGRFGNTAMAANTFMFRYMSVSFMPIFGIGTAVTALVGRYIGANRPDLANARARLGFTVAAAYALSCGLAYVLAGRHMIALFSTDESVLHLGAVLLVFAAVYQLFDAMYLVYNGALRGAGDTLAPAVATAGLCWGLTVCGGYLTARYAPQFGPAGPWVVATLYGVLLGLWMLTRWQRGRWRQIRITNPEPSNEPADLNTVVAPNT